jgi:predicted small secreted protein
MDAEKIKNHTWNQKQLIDVGIRARVQIRKFQLFHRGSGFSRRDRAESDVSVACRIDFDNYIVCLLVTACETVAGRGHHGLMQKQDVIDAESDMLVSGMDQIQCVTVSGNLSFVMILGSAAVLHDFRDALIACNNTLNGVGAFN